MSKFKDGNSVKEGLFKELKDCSSSLKIRGVKRLKDKSVLLELNGERDVKLIKEKIEISETFQTSIPGKILPRILVYDVDKRVNGNQFIQDLIIKNLDGVGKVEQLEKELKLLSRMNGKEDKCNLVFSVSGRIFNRLMNFGRIFINFDSHRIREYTSITRCYKCQGFGHTSRVCSKTICGHCVQEGHDFKTCKN